MTDNNSGGFRMPPSQQHNRQVQRVDPANTLVELKQALANEKQRIQKLLPPGMTADQQLSAVMLLVNSKPDILKCSVASIMQSIHTASSFGLILGSSRADAYLVPFKGQCTCMIAYRGLLRLAYNSGKLAFADARLVFEGEEISIKSGFEQDVDHKQMLDGLPGKLRGAYFLAKLTNGTRYVYYMTREQMDIYRQRSMAANSGFSPWKTDENAMYLKTVIRRGVNLLPWSTEDRMLDALAADDSEDEAPATKQIEKPKGNAAALASALAEKHAEDGWEQDISTLEEANDTLPGFEDERDYAADPNHAN